MKFDLLLMLILSVLASSCVEAPRMPANTRGQHSLHAPYLWAKSSFPRTINVSNSFTAAEYDNIRSMGNAWGSSVNNQVQFFAWGVSVDEKTPIVTDLDVFLDNTLGVYKLTKWPFELPANALAVTQIYGRRFNTGSSNEFVNIEHADILVNVERFQYFTGDTGASGQFDLRTVMLHEFGHFLGLPHNSLVDRTQSVMYPSITSSERKRSPMNPDIAAIAEKYNIAMGSVGAGAMAYNGPALNYQVPEGEEGEELKILLELHADGTCVHKENGVEVHRHHADL
jgi:hypothetical protein